jgi:putative Mn2+ efflux pump MntP
VHVHKRDLSSVTFHAGSLALIIDLLRLDFIMANDSSDIAHDAHPHAMRVYLLAIVTSMGAFMFGYDLAFIGTSIDLESFQR